MKITVSLPDDIAQRPDPRREALEAIAVAGYKSGDLTAYEARRVLGMESRFEFEAFLKDRNIMEHAYSVEDLEEDIKTMRELEARRESKSHSTR